LFLIAGDGLMREQLASQAERLGIQARIRWLGWQKDLEDFYNSIDLLLFNSDWDAQARTPLETMARGIPVVASVREGGTNEFILDKSMGVLFIDHDVQGLAGAVCDLMANREELLAMGRAARERVRVHGSPEKHARNVLEALGIEKLDFEKAE
jgi:glycosyltransferase involved in cell wall biosynthesis